ncbi:MAG TPA: hypothetical protein ENK66_02580 [Arcobacter sp.]|nr:hypothetical protein [Arcobacter sp.]
MAGKSHTGFVVDNILLSVGRAILRKQVNESRNISDDEAYGLALAAQGRYGFVPEQQKESFATEIVRSFRYVEQRELQSVSKLAYASFQKDQYLGNSIFDEQLAKDLHDLGFVTN